jgi:tRNA threonylcarbamoyladenosine biosynthesis protein TsaB
MNKLIIDVANENIFLMVITNNNTYNVTHPNSKINYEKLVVLINSFLLSKNLTMNDLREIYVNRGPGSFAGIRNSLSVVKAINLALKIDYYCYSYQDFNNVDNFEYENVPNLCNKFKIKKNLINPIYIS